MVTPILDPNWRQWCTKDSKIQDAITDYKAEQFQRYLASGWCRLEMFFNANIKFKAERHKYFGGKLREVMIAKGQRPHLLFGTREMQTPGEMPIIMRHLEDDEFEKYHPGKGSLSNDDDRPVIGAYVNQLLEINENLKPKLQVMFIPADPRFYATYVCVLCMYS
jgi:hypothetical protein